MARRIAVRVWPRLSPARNVGFSSRLREDAGAPAVVLSPHLDDAVLNCWSVLTGAGEVQVVNVFAAPPDSATPSSWDRIAGARDSRAHFAERLSEDRRALARAGRSPLNLAFHAEPYRGASPPPSFRALDAAIAESVGTASAVLAPAALGTVHPDHALIRDLAVALAGQGLPVRLYADLPYCAVYGWPHWVTGDSPDPHLDVDAYWGLSLGNAPAFGSRAGADVVRLDDGRASEKLAAMRAYRTQFPTLDRGPVGLLSNPAIHRYEVFWTLR